MTAQENKTQVATANLVVANDISMDDEVLSDFHYCSTIDLHLQ